MEGVTVTTGKVCKLFIHQKQFSEHDLIINLKEFPDLKEGDVVEIYHQEDAFSRLLLQVKELSADALQLQQKGTISIHHNIATNFKLRLYKDVVVNPVNPRTVVLDLAELTYKEQYFSRADMWRLRQSLVKGCIYLTKKVLFAEMRAQVSELWAKGEQVTCGVVTEDTRVTLRSSTAQVNIFLQMSSEMWEFDNYGDLYFEKAIGGFLVELFNQWKDKNCNHDVTITLFSRTFYDASKIEDFPMHMRECVQQNNQGRFYEDFYRVVVQNERYDDWTPTIVQLKRLFLEYQDGVLRFHEREGFGSLRAWNSTAAQGNFLEVLNMALNAFEKHYLDRSFDRTGKLSIVITPGTGVFDVDRELMNITKQRTIDCGNGSDLVCMGEQPLHAVPLFKFHSKNPQTTQFTSDVGDDYNIPHWINHSFYTSHCQSDWIRTAKFLPRITVPVEQDDHWKSCKRTPVKQRLSDSQTGILNSIHDDMNLPFVDYDDYDTQVFKLPNQRINKQSMSVSHHSSIRRQRPSASRWSGVPQRVPRVRCNSDITQLLPEKTKPTKETTKTILIPQVVGSVDSTNYMSNSYGGCSVASSNTEEDVFMLRPVVGSAGSPVGHHGTSHPYFRPTAHRRALINPFAPSRLHFKVTSNRRRWAHAFPTDPRGASIQPHHIHSSGALSGDQHDLTLLQGQSVCSPRVHQVSESSDGITMEVHGRTKSLTMSSAESGSEDSSSLKEQVLTGPSVKTPQHGVPHAVVGQHAPQHTVSAASLHKVDSTSSMGSIYNMYDLHSGSVGSAGRGRSWTVGIPGAGSGRAPPSGADTYPPSSLPRAMEEGHYWVWGTTGEQEWTPEMTTEEINFHDLVFKERTECMDWKSMTMPAALPITTDYFPDRRSLQMDYVMSNYELLPDDVNSDWHTASRSVRKPLTTAQVYRELVAQRLAQGFQLVILPKIAQRSGTDLVGLSSSPYQQSGFQQAGASAGGLLRARSKVETVEEHILSIGRIFHKLSMKGNNITVQRYWPKHPYPQKSIHYTYRFQVPDSGSYDVSWTNFSYEKLENYNWNYVDLYILTRGGEEDFSLMESLKYWRSRFCLLPSNNPATRKIIEGSTRCDIYEDTPTGEQTHLIDGFLRFIEIMNKIKRHAQSRKPKMATARRHSGDVHGRSNKIAVRRHSLTQSPVGTLGADRATDLVSKTKGGPKTNEACDSPTTPAMPATPSELKKSALPPVGTDMTPGGSTMTSPSPFYRPEAGLPADRTLTVHSPLKEIREAMVDNAEGLSFLNQQSDLPSLPNHTFIAAEAVTWVRNNIAGISDLTEAAHLLQTMVDEQMICHASGNPDHRFIYGFFLYHVIGDADKKKDIAELFNNKEGEKVRDRQGGDSTPDQPDPGVLLYPSKYYYNTSFQYEWCETAVLPPTVAAPASQPCTLPSDSVQSQYLRTTSPRSQNHQHGPHDWGGRSTQSPVSGSTGYRKTMATPDLMLDLAKMSSSGASPMYKVVNVDVDPTLKSDRQEWGTARYHGNYSPSCAFELEVQWLVATGCIMGELVAGWSRKASSYGFHFLPIPGDPFALPFNANSDPLRGPVFVPLDLDCLQDPCRDHNLDASDSSNWEETLLVFQEAVLKRFGFMPDRCLPNRTGFAFGDNSPPQYVHCTGGMFVLIPDIKATSPRNRDGTHRKPAVGSYLDYIIHQRRRSDSSGLGNDMVRLVVENGVQEVGSPMDNLGIPLPTGEPRVGFLWAWNYMLNKKWRTASTGDEHFQDKMLADFRAFCSNTDGRLWEFWLCCRQMTPPVTNGTEER